MALHYEIIIKANPQTVWDIMLGKDTYPKWTAIFKEGSYFEGDWSLNSEMLFWDLMRKAILVVWPVA